MEHCVELAARPRRDAILYAIAEHDNGWTEEDAAPTVNPETGHVVDFVGAPLSVRHAVWSRSVRRLRDRRWAAALVAQHAITVYDRFRSEAGWTPFFVEMETARGEILRAGGLPLEILLPTMCCAARRSDSLTFCTGWADEQRVGDWTVQLSSTQVVVTPDPFGGATIPMRFEIRNRRINRMRSCVTR